MCTSVQIVAPQNIVQNIQEKQPENPPRTTKLNYSTGCAAMGQSTPALNVSKCHEIGIGISALVRLV
jgi:hypothetical protein